MVLSTSVSSTLADATTVSSEDNTGDSRKGDSDDDSSVGITVALLIVVGALVCMLVAGVVHKANKPSAGEQQASGADREVVYSTTSNAAFEMPSGIYC